MAAALRVALLAPSADSIVSASIAATTDFRFVSFINDDIAGKTQSDAELLVESLVCERRIAGAEDHIVVVAGFFPNLAETFTQRGISLKTHQLFSGLTQAHSLRP